VLNVFQWDALALVKLELKGGRNLTVLLLHEKINKWINELMGQDLVEIGELVNDFEFVKEVLNQAETLIAQHSCSSAVNRTHTALHGYLKEICK
jgi:hypothetical protein